MRLTIGRLKRLITETKYRAWRWSNGNRFGDPIEIDAEDSIQAGRIAARELSRRDGIRLDPSGFSGLDVEAYSDGTTVVNPSDEIGDDELDAMISSHETLHQQGTGQSLNLTGRRININKNIFAMRDVQGAVLTRMVADYVDFTGTIFVSAYLGSVRCRHSTFVGADLRSAVFKNSILESCDFGQTTLGLTDFRGARLVGSQFEQCHRWPHDASANFDGADIRGVSFIESDLEKSSFARVKGTNTNFQRTNLYECNFRRAELGGANFRNTHAKFANFSRALLVGADFGGANLKGADFRGADLTNADFRGAYTDGALGLP